MYVIKFNNGLYWIAFNSASTQLRKAKIYNSLRMAKEAGEDCLKRAKSIKLLDTKNKPVDPINSFTIVEVEIKEVEEVEAIHYLL